MKQSGGITYLGSGAGLESGVGLENSKGLESGAGAKDGTAINVPSNKTADQAVAAAVAPATMLPLICLHGIGGSADSFAPQLMGLRAALPQAQRIIAWNMPGYGGAVPLQETSFATLSDALARFMDELNIDEAHIIGHSIGGMIALEFALRFPTRAASLALLATTSAFGGRDATFKTQFLRARLAPLEAGATMAELAQEFIPQIVGPDTPPHIIAAAHSTMASVPAETYRAIMTCLITFNRRNDLPKLTCPVCLLAGALDTNAPAKTMAKMAEQINGAEFHTLADVGHLPNLEAPGKTNKILADFYHSLTTRDCI